ncbi:NAD(P)/FAD-dependent oxidoreductase [Caballeronia sp. LZ035]|uniref:NAD(P)/FAD-dependent oxidoreductase n=1 Tax=Caballeronia sp. LZ035 TaxID=3038568 RepID=UPI00286735D7|nr:NAD(P)/FAD-dependent oxidoreductase [Caballeronia sp. LZ035]MDR5758745.1 NAD(P)/FAD-dependent oxidoreductase [Caballeronia sp. LZ035]
METHFDVIVIGGSFAGLSAAMQLARARRRVLVLDGGRPRNRFAPHSHGFFGQDGRTPADIIHDATAQLLAYPIAQLAMSEALTADREAGRFVVTRADGAVSSADRLILATGVRDELPALPGLEARWGKSVLHCPYCHGYEVADKRLGVLATHPLSIHQAMLIPDWGPTTWFTQGIVEPTSDEAALLAARHVRIERSRVVEVLGNAPDMTGLRLADGRVVGIDALFAAPRTHQASPLAQQLGCALKEGALGPFVAVDDAKQTSVPGVFAAGDAATEWANATFASAAGVAAGVAAHRSLIFGV